MKKLTIIILILIAVGLILGFRGSRLGSRVDTSGWVFLSGGNTYTNGNVGISTSTLTYDLNIWSATTTKTFIGSTATTTGACDIRQDSDGGGFTYVTYLNGAVVATTTPCQ